jgi:hypothetical protein
VKSTKTVTYSESFIGRLLSLQYMHISYLRTRLLQAQQIELMISQLTMTMG